jgi:hypothetical protein
MYYQLILPAVLYEREIPSLNPREKGVEKISSHKREEVTGGSQNCVRKTII